MNNSKSSAKVRHSFTIHPVLLQWLIERANADYDGNVSAALAGLILFDRGVMRAKALKGQPHRHYTTPGITQHRDSLEAAIREIESDDPGFNAVTWVEMNLRVVPVEEVARELKKDETPDQL